MTTKGPIDFHGDDEETKWWDMDEDDAWTNGWGMDEPYRDIGKEDDQTAPGGQR